MKTRPLIITDAERAEIARVIAYAERKRFSTADMLARADCKQVRWPEHVAEDLRETDPNRSSMGDDPGFVCKIPVGFRVCFTIEEQPAPLDWCRHISISVDEAGMMPHPAAVEMILQAFGYRDGIEANIFYIEQGRAVNVIEPLVLPTYALGEDGASITCLGCGMTSHHPEDVARRYCGHCHVFHRDIPPAERRRFIDETPKVRPASP